LTIAIDLDKRQQLAAVSATDFTVLPDRCKEMARLTQGYRIKIE